MCAFVFVRLRQKSPDGDPVPVVMRDTIGFILDQGKASLSVLETLLLSSKH